MLELPKEPYYLHDVPSDMDVLIYQYICECGDYSDEQTAYPDSYWSKAFDEDSEVNVELDLGLLWLGMVQDLPGLSNEKLESYKNGLGSFPPLLQNGWQFVDGRHRAALYKSLGYKRAVSIDLEASGIDVDIPESHTNLLH